MYNFRIKKIILRLFLIGIITLNQNLSAQYNDISDYRKYFATGKYNGIEVSIIRTYISHEKQFFIAVNPNNIKTYIIPAEEILETPKTWTDILNQYSNSAYVKAINTAKEKSFPMQDAGIQHGNVNEKGIILTIDLCPSHKPLDRIIFTSIANEFLKMNKPQAIALSITGKFLNSHPEDIEWLKEMSKSGSLEIVWINHTYNHNYDPKLPIQENFLFEPKTNLDTEILLLEKSLLEKQILFSAFFRFPGLVSDAELINKVTEYGLIPIGSDAWLAKGQIAKNGDIVLIHGNGNEPLGVKDFLQLLKKEKEAVVNKEWQLYDLRESIEQEFEKK